MALLHYFGIFLSLFDGWSGPAHIHYLLLHTHLLSRLLTDVRLSLPTTPSFLHLLFYFSARAICYSIYFCFDGYCIYFWVIIVIEALIFTSFTIRLDVYGICLRLLLHAYWWRMLVILMYFSIGLKIPQLHACCCTHTSFHAACRGSFYQPTTYFPSPCCSHAFIAAR